MNHGFLLPKGITTSNSKLFGRTIKIKHPDECELIILCGNTGGGYRPYWCGLPHQIYTEDIKETFKKENFESIYALPVNGRNSVFIAARDKYSLQRWKHI